MQFENEINEQVQKIIDQNASELDSINDVRLQQLKKLFFASDFCSRVATQYPEYTYQLLVENSLDCDYSDKHYYDALNLLTKENLDENRLSQKFRAFRNQQMLRIAWRDLMLKTDVEIILAELSYLADAFLNVALEKMMTLCVTEHGEPLDENGAPIKLVILAMGKLGAFELNFSSDIDLIFCYKEEGQLSQGRKLSYNQFFVKLSQRIIRLLDDVTAYGMVYRVDTRLRPFGNSGQLALSFDAMETYYERHGREWERYAMVKARVISEDIASAEELMQRLKPFVYRKYLDFGALESLRDMKALIETDLKRKGIVNNIKLGPGGIREIEFIGQAFQLIRGGRTKELQKRGILEVLALLQLLNLIPEHVYFDLKKSYLFFRKVENAIQAYDDQQTHEFPTEERHQYRLATALGYDNWRALHSDILSRMNTVHEIFEQIFSAPQLQSYGAEGDSTSLLVNQIWNDLIDIKSAETILESLGYTDASQARLLIIGFRNSLSYKSTSPKGQVRIDKLMPLIILSVCQTEYPNLTLLRLISLMEKIARRSAYVALLSEYPMGLSQLVQLVGKSELISEMLTQSPILLDELLDPRRLYEKVEKPELTTELKSQLFREDDNFERHMQVLCEFKQSNIFRVAASELQGALPVNQISDNLSNIAEVVMDGAEKIALKHIENKHGRPTYFTKNKNRVANFCIVAYGKLGSMELGFSSDLDVVFLHDSEGEKQVTTGENSVENGYFFIRVAQRIMHILNTRSQYGVLYELDTRLRPSGGSGVLVSNLQGFAEYQRKKAWTWEHQALIRARVITGSEYLVTRFEKIRLEILTLQRDHTVLRKDVCNMRLKIRNELYKKKANLFNIKQSAGGITDIEFIIQFLTLAWANKYPDLTRYTDNLRILESLVKNAILSEENARILREAYLLFREKVHKNTLQKQSLAIELTDDFKKHQQGVLKIWNNIMENDEK